MLKGFISADHLPVAFSTTTTQAAVIAALNGYGIVQDPSSMVNGNANWTSGIVSDSEGVWYGNSIGGSGLAFTCRGWCIPLWRIMDFTTRASYFGFRLKFASTISINGGAAVAQILPSVGASSSMAFCQVLSKTSTTQGGVLSILNNVNFPNSLQALDVSYFIEVKFDRANSLLTVWLDGVQIAQSTFNFATITPDMFLCIGPTGNYTGAIQSGTTTLWKDAYFVDDTQDANLPNSRIGTVSAKKMALLTASGTSWVSSDSKTLLADLQTAVTSVATLATPNITSNQAAVPNELDFTVDSSGVLANVPIAGVMTVMGGARLQGTMTKLEMSARDQATPTPHTKAFGSHKFAPAATVITRSKSGILLTAPDGSALTAAKLAALTFVAQPAYPTTF